MKKQIKKLGNILYLTLITFIFTSCIDIDKDYMIVTTISQRVTDEDNKYTVVTTENIFKTNINYYVGDTLYISKIKQ